MHRIASHRIAFSSWMMVLGLSVAPSGLAGCAKGVLNDQTVDSWGTIGSAEDTGTMPVMDGTLWCARLPPHPEAPMGTQGCAGCQRSGAGRVPRLRPRLTYADACCAGCRTRRWPSRGGGTQP